MRTSKFELVTFDVFSALFDLKRSLLPTIKSVLGDRVDPVSFFSEWRETQLNYVQIDTLLSRGHTSFKDLTLRALLHSCLKLGVRASEPALDQLILSWYNLEPFAEVNSALRNLQREGYELALLSNGDMDMLLSLSKKLDVKLSHIFSAEDAGVYKPHPSVYSQVVEATGLTKDKIVHVAGGADDALGSKSFGFFTVWVNRAGAPAKNFPFQPDKIISGLDALAPTLRKLQLNRAIRPRA